MQVRFVQLGSIAATGTLLALASAPGMALKPPTEDSLLGIRLMSTYRDVLRKFKQPTEIQPGDPVVTEASGTFDTPTTSGGALGGGGGLPGFPGGAGGMTPGLPSISPFPGGMGGSGIPGLPGGAGGIGGAPGMMGSRGGIGGSRRSEDDDGPTAGSGSLPGFAGGATNGMAARRAGMMRTGGMGAAGSLPGFPGGPGAMGGAPGMMGTPGMGSRFGGAMGGGSTYGNNVGGYVGGGVPEVETTWWYHFPAKGLHYSFLFNKAGRVIQIQEYGWKGGSTTRGGVALGSPLGKVIKSYGWSNNGEATGPDLVFRYGGQHKVMFQLVNNKVVGISVAVVK